MKVGVCGLQIGDEGKGRVVDSLLERHPEPTVVMRYSGGANAGHTVDVNGEEIALHIVPSGILRENTYNFVGTGVLFDIPRFFDDVNQIDARMGQGYATSRRIGVSGRCYLVFDYHRQQEEAEERLREEQGDLRIGTTKRGIGPASEDIAAREAINVATYLDRDRFLRAVERTLKKRQALWGSRWPEDGLPMEADAYEREYCQHRERLREFLYNEGTLLRERANDFWILEGAQGTMLDPQYGIFPFVTTTPIVRKPRADREIGVMKAAPSSVGERPLVTQMDPETEERFRMKEGQEFGATSKRPRQVCWPDLVIAGYAARVQGIDSFALTKLDAYTGERDIKLCVAYKLGGKRITDPPEHADAWRECTPEYEFLPGWDEPIINPRSLNDLPRHAAAFVARIEAGLGVPPAFISFGKERSKALLLGA